MNESIFNLNQPYTIAIIQQLLRPGFTNCMEFNFNKRYREIMQRLIVIIVYKHIII